jgi:hypothetical protein
MAKLKLRRTVREETMPGGAASCSATRSGIVAHISRDAVLVDPAHDGVGSIVRIDGPDGSSA